MLALLFDSDHKNIPCERKKWRELGVANLLPSFRECIDKSSIHYT